MLVTGASGLLGANFLQIAQRQQQKTIGVYHKHPIQLPNVTLLQADLTSGQTTRELLATYRPTCIVHCAALTNVDHCQTHPKDAYQVNVEMTYNLAVAAQKVGAHFVYISTDSVFGGQTGNYTETDETAPCNVYAQTKLEGERVAQAETPECLIIRTNIYGWNWQKKMSLAEWILSRLEANQIIPGFKDVTFAPIFVNQLSLIILDMVKQDLRGIYHVCGSETVSKYQFAHCLAKVFEKDDALVRPTAVDSSQLTAPRPRHTALCTDKVTRALNKHMPDVWSGLNEFKRLRNIAFQ